MIQQPELGKTIADLRKAKGLTQEELVEKCNLNVRTLQRIESGEVMPRTYTIRLIFEALEVPFDKSLNDKGLILKLLGQFYISFIDLFNLKTNTMKKISILTAIVTLIVIGATSLNSVLKAQNDLNNSDKHSQKNINEANEVVFQYISCDECFGLGEENLFTGRGVKFEINGVKAFFSLITIDKYTREFQGSLKGKLLVKKVELSCAHDRILNGTIKYSADKISENDKTIKLVGNAKIEAKNSWIETEEIIITLR